jgi:hypothetical protein
MGIVVQFRRPVASSEVIAKLVELGYLRPAKRHKIGVVENAVDCGKISIAMGLSERAICRPHPKTTSKSAMARRRRFPRPTGIEQSSRQYRRFRR